MRLDEIAFDFLLPIGGACQTRYQIERYIKKKYNFKQPACFFDWLGLGGLRGVIYIIENEFKVYPKDFIVKSVYSENNYAPIHVPSGFRFMHDFGFNSTVKGKEELAICTLQGNMGESINKYSYLGCRTERILSSNKNIGLVYHGRLSATLAMRLLNLLENKYGENFYIINIMNLNKEFPVLIPRLFNLVVDNARVKGLPEEWKGDNESWDRALDSITFSKEDSLYSVNS